MRMIWCKNENELLNNVFHYSVPVSCGLCEANGCYCTHQFPGSCGNGSEDYDRELVIIGDIEDLSEWEHNDNMKKYDYVFIIGKLSADTMKKIPCKVIGCITP